MPSLSYPHLPLMNQKNLQKKNAFYLTPRGENVNIFTLALFYAIFITKEFPKASETPPYPTLKFYDESDFHTFEV